MTTIQLDAEQIKKAVIRSQHCQRNWDTNSSMSPDDISILEHAVTNCPSKQNVGFYHTYLIQDRSVIEKIHDATNGFVLNPETGETTTNTQTLAHLLIAFTKRDLNEWQGSEEHRNIQLDAWKSESQTPDSAKKDLSNDAQIAVGVAAGYVNVIASMLGYATGCCSCFNAEEIKGILDTDDDIMLLMGVGVPDRSRPRREHHINKEIVFPTKKKVPIKVTHI